jgi:hypothetical protein
LDFIDFQWDKKRPLKIRDKKRPLQSVPWPVKFVFSKKYGAACVTRTRDPRITNAMLYQLS